MDIFPSNFLGTISISFLNKTYIFSHCLEPKKHENGDWRSLHNEKIHSLYRSHNIVGVIKCRKLRWVGNVARMEESRSAFKILTGTPAEKRLLGRLGRRREDNIRKNPKEIGCIDSAQNREYWKALMNSSFNLRVS
jgi:hypothetical protein